MTTFAQKLDMAMKQSNLTRKEACSLIDCGPSSLSMWLDGKHEPNKDRQKKILKALGADGFIDEERPERTKMRKASAQDVALAMGIAMPTLYKGLQQGIFPWGYAIRTTDHSWAYVINADRFEQIEGIAI